LSYFFGTLPVSPPARQERIRRPLAELLACHACARVPTTARGRRRDDGTALAFPPGGMGPWQTGPTLFPDSRLTPSGSG
jgi:hypothetical protein